jgi:hypothetical protein
VHLCRACGITDRHWFALRPYAIRCKRGIQDRARLVRLLLQNGAGQDLEEVNERGETAPHAAVRVADAEVRFGLLLQGVASCVAYQACCALCRACMIADRHWLDLRPYAIQGQRGMQDRARLVRLLLQHGVPQELDLEEVNERGETALHAAVRAAESQVRLGLLLCGVGSSGASGMLCRAGNANCTGMQNSGQGGRGVRGSCYCSRGLARGWIWRNERGETALHAAVRVGDTQVRLFACLLLFGVANAAVYQARCKRVCGLLSGTGLPWQFVSRTAGKGTGGGEPQCCSSRGGVWRVGLSGVKQGCLLLCV